MMRTLQSILLCSYLLLAGCDLPGSSEQIDAQSPPSIVSASVSPTLIDFANVSITGSTVDITLTGSVNVSDDNGLSDISAVSYSIFSPSGSLFGTGTISDNGVAPDPSAGDGIYNSQIVVKLPKEVIGTYVIQFSTVDKSGFTSSTHSIPLKIILSTNNPPVISKLSAPDSVRVPDTADSVNFIDISLSVSDPQGLSDIGLVILTSQRPDSSVAGTFYMSDDGGKTKLPQFQLTSGDSIAGDGVYSIVIPMFNTAAKNTYRDFIFTARDQSGAFSNAIVKRIFIQ